MKQVTAIQTGEEKEVSIEDLLMKLSMAEQVIHGLCNYIENPDTLPVDDWAITGAFQNIQEIGLALKCACWGHEEAHLH